MMRLINTIAAGIVAMTLSLDGLLIVSAFAAVLAVGGYLTLWWPGFAFAAAMVTLGGLAGASVLAFIVLPLVIDVDEDDLS